jgi:hypothetical protein
MRRSAVAWILAASLAALGSLWAHEVAYRIVAADEADGAQLLARTGHGYLEHAPLAVGLLLVVIALAVALRAISAARGAAPGTPPAWPFALVPVLGFALQEHLERFLHTGELPLAAALEPTFLVGIGLQLPFALAALLVARVLLGLAHELGRALASRPPVLGLAPAPSAVLPREVRRPGPAKLALGWGERGPPF